MFVFELGTKDTCGGWSEQAVRLMFWTSRTNKWPPYVKLGGLGRAETSNIAGEHICPDVAGVWAEMVLRTIPNQQQSTQIRVKLLSI